MRITSSSTRSVAWTVLRLMSSFGACHLFENFRSIDSANDEELLGLRLGCLLFKPDETR